MGGGGGGSQKPTDEERGLARDAARRWNDYVDRYVPVENEFMRRLEVTPNMEAGARGQMHADARQAQGQLAGDMHLGMSNQGVAPGSGRAVMARGDLEGATLAASGLAGANKVQGLYDRRLAGQAKMAAFGRGLQDQASMSLAQAGARATDAGTRALGQRVDGRGNLMAGLAGAGAMYAAGR